MSNEIKTFGVVLFYTSSAALRAEKILLKGGLTAKLIPTPREFSSDCGVALRFIWNDEQRVRALLTAANMEIAAIHCATASRL
jgi:hypothetical protein